MSSEKGMYYIDSEDLISEVQKFPCLYDQDCDDYKNRLLRLETWRNISRTVVGSKWEDMSKEERYKVGKIVQKRWKSLKDAFTRALRYQEERAANGGLMKRPYIYFKQMSFLAPMFYSRYTTRSNLDDSERDETERDYEDTDCVDNKDGILPYPAGDESTLSGEGELLTPDLRDPLQKRMMKFQDTFDQDVIGTGYDQNKTAHQAAVATSIPFRFEHDPDSMFLMSLLPTFKRIKPENRVDAQIEILNVLKTYTCGPSHTAT